METLHANTINNAVFKDFLIDQYTFDISFAIQPLILEHCLTCPPIFQITRKVHIDCSLFWHTGGGMNIS